MQSGKARTKEWFLEYEVFNPKPDAPRIIPYADNFSFKRTEPWTH
jgi:hypothetical protein